MASRPEPTDHRGYGIEVTPGRWFGWVARVTTIDYGLPETGPRFFRFDHDSALVAAVRWCRRDYGRRRPADSEAYGYDPDRDVLEAE